MAHLVPHQLEIPEDIENREELKSKRRKNVNSIVSSFIQILELISDQF